jgi:Na+/proline symporter
VAWGLLITGFAFVVGQISDTVIEAINKIGSAFYGPILAAFLVGVLSKRVHARDILVGILAGVGFNLMLWMAFPGVYWMWWNLFGCALTAAVAMGLSRTTGKTAPSEKHRYTLHHYDALEKERRWLPAYALLAGYFVLLLAVLYLIQGMASGQ